MKNGWRDKIAGKFNDQIAKKVEELANHMEDIACAQDDMTKALVTIYRDINVIAKNNNIKLEKPLINMDIEEGSIDGRERKHINISKPTIDVEDLNKED